jgi:hypothetical protein
MRTGALLLVLLAAACSGADEKCRGGQARCGEGYPSCPKDYLCLANQDAELCCMVNPEAHAVDASPDAFVPR